MRFRGRAWLLPLLTIAPPLQPVAAAPAPAWQSDWGDDTCSLIRVPPGPDAILLAIRVMPGGDRVSVNLIHKRWSRASEGAARDVVLALDPGGAVPADALYIPRSVIQGPALTFWVTDPGFLGRLAASRTLSVEERGKPLASYTLPSAAQAVSSLRACERDALTGWGIDADAWFKLKSPPIAKKSIASLITDADYPPEAERHGISGKVVVRLTVDARGKPVACVAAQSTDSSLDRGTCEVIMKRARFQPALDADGKPVAAPFVTRMIWLIPPD